MLLMVYSLNYFMRKLLRFHKLFFVVALVFLFLHVHNQFRYVLHPTGHHLFVEFLEEKVGKNGYPIGLINSITLSNWRTSSSR